MVAYITVFNLFDHVCRFEHAFCGLNRHVCSSKFQVYCLNPLLESVRSFILGQITRNYPSSAQITILHHFTTWNPHLFQLLLNPINFPPVTPGQPSHRRHQSIQRRKASGVIHHQRGQQLVGDLLVCGAHFSANLDASFRNPKGSPLWKMPCIYIYIYIYI